MMKIQAGKNHSVILCSALVAYIIFKFKKTSRDMGPVQLNIYVGEKHPCNYVI